MENSGQSHAPAALLQGKLPTVTIEWELGWTSEHVWDRFGKDMSDVQLVYIDLWSLSIMLIEGMLTTVLQHSACLSV